ncbi:MAG: hypothetical protein JJE46_12165, partial [Acidimicrobiia bacterium]|nr:hypothetical protein [Acidimicrobiia bacterium]
MAVVDAVSESTPASTRRRSPSMSEWAVVVGAGLVLVTASPQVSATYWSPKTAIVLVGLGPGVVALLLAARARDRAALAGLG